MMSVTWDARNLNLATGEHLLYCLRVRGPKMAVVAAANPDVAESFKDGFIKPRVLKGRSSGELIYNPGDFYRIVVSTASLENTDNVDIDHALMVGPDMLNANILPALDTGNVVNQLQVDIHDWIPLGRNIQPINEGFKLTRIKTRVQM